MEKQIKFKEAFSYGWKAMIANFWAFLLTFIILFAICGLANYVNDLKGNFCMEAIFFLAYYLILGFASAMLMKILLNVYNKKQMFDKMEDVFPRLIKFIAAYFLYLILTCLGLALLVIPGIIIAIKYQYVPFLIIDKNLSIGEAFTESSAMTAGVQWPLFAFWIFSVLISGFGFLVFGIGALFTVPTVWMAVTFMYKDLLKQKKD